MHCDIGGYPDTVNVENLTSYKVCLAASPTFSPSGLDFITPHQRKNISLIVSQPMELFIELLHDTLGKHAV